MSLRKIRHRNPDLRLPPAEFQTGVTCLAALDRHHAFADAPFNDHAPFNDRNARQNKEYTLVLC
jgi:hypothetical protein